MKASPYLAFNGECAEAVALYEKALGVKAGAITRYRDLPPSEGYTPPAGTEDFIVHTQFDFDSGAICMCDTTPDNKCSFSNEMSVHMELDSENAVKAAFDVLKEGGEVEMEPAATFWSKCFGTLTDRFGVSWMLSFEQCSE